MGLGSANGKEEESVSNGGEEAAETKSRHKHTTAKAQREVDSGRMARHCRAETCKNARTQDMKTTKKFKKCETSGIQGRKKSSSKNTRTTRTQDTQHKTQESSKASTDLPLEMQQRR